MLLAHGVGRIYQLPVPLAYYLTGSAIAVIASFLAVGFLGRRPAREHRRLAGERPASILAKTVRIGIWAGYLLALVTGVTNNATGFGFPAIWLWVGLVVGLTILNVIFGGLWRMADPWLPLAAVWGIAGRRTEGGLARFAGPVLIYALFWFELASNAGFDVPVITKVLVLYAVWAIWTRIKFEDWERVDPFCIIWEFASRSSLLSTSVDGIYLRSPGADPADREPLPAPLYVSLFLLLGATSLDNLRETPYWTHIQNQHFYSVPPVLYDSISLALLALPFFFTFRLALLPSRRSLGGASRTMGWSLAPISIAYVLAHNASLVMVTLKEWFINLSDPFGVGWNLLGIGELFRDFVPSPALVWIIEVGLVVGGHVMAVVMGHRIAQGLTDQERAPMAAQIPLTLLMSLYTVGTLWLLSLAVVRS